MKHELKDAESKVSVVNKTKCWTEIDIESIESNKTS